MVKHPRRVALAAVRHHPIEGLTVRVVPCVKEVDNRVNFGIVQGKTLWRPLCINGPELWRNCFVRVYRGVTDTGIPFRTDVPDNGSMASWSVRTFEFTPALSAATRMRVPGMP